MSEFLTLQGFNGRQDLQGQGLRPLPQDRLRRPAGHLRTAGHGRLACATWSPATRTSPSCASSAASAAWSPCAQDGFDKVMKGLTTVDEILRVTEERRVIASGPVKPDAGYTRDMKR